MTDNGDLCARIGEHLEARGERLAVAESLTGGMLSQCFSAAPSSSSWYLGGVVAYHKETKFGLLSVPEGPVVSEQAAVAMAEGVRRLTGADVAAAVTGAGGPEGQDGQPPGTVWMAVVARGRTTTRTVRFDGQPPEICEQATSAVVQLLSGVVVAERADGPSPPDLSGAQPVGYGAPVSGDEPIEPGKGARMTTDTARAAEVFSLRTPYLSEGRTDTTLVQTDQLTVRIKVYAEGGENALHTHAEEDHVFVVLEGQATFHDAEGRSTVVGPSSGILQPAGAYYRFESSGDRNLVLLRAGSGKPQGSNDRRGPDGKELPGGSKENKRVPGVPVPGSFFGDG